jgi:hypothetical protein
MARTINSPGVQITEIDLSTNLQLSPGTSIFATGFAPQGPTDEVLNITSISELEQVYGTPTTPAERYFYHTCKEILNSPASLLTTRLPYGSGSGEGFTGTEYSALFFPVASSEEGFIVGTPTQLTVQEEDYNNLLQNNFNWGGFNNGTETLTTSSAFISSYENINYELSASFIDGLADIPGNVTPELFDVEDNLDGTVTIEFTVTTLEFTTVDIITPGSYDGSLLDAGIVFINTSQTTINQNYEGYYLAITDNTNFGPQDGYTSIRGMFAIGENDQLTPVPASQLAFLLSATQDFQGSNSISERIESIPTFDFNDDYYNDSVIVTLFKVRSSIYEPEKLTTSLVESFIGSFDPNKKIVAVGGGVQRTFYLPDIVNNLSNNLKVLINPNISTSVNWVDPNTENPGKNVRVNDGAKALYSAGTYAPTYIETPKYVGSILNKIDRALSLVDTPENVSIDVVVDGGLSTIYAITNGNGVYSDIEYVEPQQLTDMNSTVVNGWAAVFRKFDNFVKNTRKDCVFISDPLRHIFVNSENTKTISIKSNTFTQNIFNPLKLHYGVANSNYSVAYGNWVRVYDQFIDRQLWAPASGYVAAIYARTDSNAQPWIAPAGLNRGLLDNVIDLAFNPNQKQRDLLYTIGINPVVFFPSDGFVVFGQKTLQRKPSAFDRVNVRRLFLALEKVTQQSLKYFVFEPNTEFTRSRLVNTLTPLFENAKSTEGLYDYLIVCDERNNTSDVIDNNELLVDIYIKPTRAAEFILVNFIATRTGQSFEELI